MSFISYRGDGETFLDKIQHMRTQNGVIYCCSEWSIYDPARGATVQGVPAPQPLAAAILA